MFKHQSNAVIFKEVALPRGRNQGAGRLLFARPPARRRGREQVQPFSIQDLNQEDDHIRLALSVGLKNVDTHTRNPLLLLLLFGLFLLRYAQRSVWTHPHNTGS